MLHVLRLDTIGGVERRFHSYVQRSGLGDSFEHHVLLIGSRCHRHLRDGLRAAKSVSYAKYWISLKLPRRPRSLRRWNQLKTVQKVSPDIVFFWNSLSDLANLVKAALPRAATVYHDCGTSWMRRDHERVNALQQIDRVLCISRASKRLVELRWGYGGPIKVILNPLLPDFRLAGPEARKIGGSRSIRLGAAGRMVPLKGLCLALHAVRRLIDDGYPCELHLAGAGSEEARLRKMGRDLGIEGYLRFHGCLMDMTEFYRNIEILLHPALREPFGMVCLEAAAFGCVAVAACVDGIPEVVRHGETGVCLQPSLPLADYPKFGGPLEDLPEFAYDPVSDSLVPPKFLDPAVIARAVSELADSADRFESMSAAAVREASRFNFDEYVRRLDEFILEIAERRRPANGSGFSDSRRSEMS